MGGLIIWILIIIAIVYSSEQKKKGKQRTTPNVPRQSTTPVSYNEPVMHTQTSKPANSMKQTQVKRESTMEAKSTAVPKKTTVPKNAKASSYAETKHLNQVNPKMDVIVSGDDKDILVRANKNAKEYEADTMHEDTCGLHTETSENIIGSVEDLIVKGYSGEMKFERDFLAEATDMLNSFTM